MENFTLVPQKHARVTVENFNGASEKKIKFLGLVSI